MNIIKINELSINMIQPSTENMYKVEQGGSKIVVIG